MREDPSKLPCHQCLRAIPPKPGREEKTKSCFECGYPLNPYPDERIGGVRLDEATGMPLETTPRAWAAEQAAADERVKAKIEEIAARFGIVKLTETDRWWQVYAPLLHHEAGWLERAAKADPDKFKDSTHYISQWAADLADEAIAEAKKRGRL